MARKDTVHSINPGGQKVLRYLQLRTMPPSLDRIAPRSVTITFDNDLTMVLTKDQTDAHNPCMEGSCIVVKEEEYDKEYRFEFTDEDYAYALEHLN